MYTPTEKKNTHKSVITIHSDPAKVARGHRSHKSGAGIHDSRPKRLRTRSAAFRAAVRD